MHKLRIQLRAEGSKISKRFLRGLCMTPKRFNKSLLHYIVFVYIINRLGLYLVSNQGTCIVILFCAE